MLSPHCPAKWPAARGPGLSSGQCCCRAEWAQTPPPPPPRRPGQPVRARAGVSHVPHHKVLLNPRTPSRLSLGLVGGSTAQRNGHFLRPLLRLQIKAHQKPRPT